jgi:undecaprenyl-diphosphatase
LLPDPDPRLFPLINELARDTPWLHPFMTGYAHYGIAVFAALLLVGCWIARRRADPTVLAAAVWAPLGALAAVVINQPIVTAIPEPRPYAVLPDIVVLAQRGSDPSFPSDYAVLAGAVVADLWLVSGRLGAVAAVAAAVMAFAGVYIGADYPHDVLAGLVLGAGLSTIGFWATRPVLVRLLRRAEDIRPLRALLVANNAELVSR